VRNKVIALEDSAGTERKYLRVIDANLNRSREGLRVIEDTARFVFEKDTLYQQLRSLRHQLDRVTREIYPQLLRERDSAADAGRTITEGRREDISGLLIANFRRAEEALRVLEEYSRLIAPEAGPVFKEIRFNLYILEKEFLVEK
jgi:thiamine-phosphate pyrophosphorylase